MILSNSNIYTFLKYLEVIFFTGVILYFGKSLFIPLFFGLLVAIIMYPACKWLEQKGWLKSIAIGAVLGIVTIIFATLLWLLIWQLQLFRQDLPGLTQKLETNLPVLQTWIERNFGFSITWQNDFLQNSASVNNISNLLKGTLNNTINTLFYLVIVPVFSALFLYHRRTFVRYLQLIAGREYLHQLSSILRQTTHTYFNFIKGMLMVYVVVGILNSIGLMALGIKHAILFGMLTAIMTIIPYIGIIVSALLPITVAWITKDSIWYPIGVIAVFAFVQYLEANVIFPMIVGTQLNVSTWATLVAFIAGGILWGVAGMILFIPFVAILKIVADNVEDWKPLDILLNRTPDLKG